MPRRVLKVSILQPTLQGLCHSHFCMSLQSFLLVACRGCSDSHCGHCATRGTMMLSAAVWQRQMRSLRGLTWSFQVIQLPELR